jgi:hypothetical protein
MVNKTILFCLFTGQRETVSVTGICVPPENKVPDVVRRTYLVRCISPYKYKASYWAFISLVDSIVELIHPKLLIQSID